MMANKGKGRKRNKKNSENKKIEKKPLEIKKAENKNDIKPKPKKINDESELEEEVEDSPKMPAFFQQFQSAKSSPVLEKVARTQETNLEQQISNMQSRKNEEERFVRYGGEKSDYEIAKPDEGRMFQYAETPATYNSVSGEKKKDVVDFNAPKQKWEIKGRQRNATGMERAGMEEFQSERHGAKYLTKRKY